MGLSRVQLGSQQVLIALAVVWVFWGCNFVVIKTTLPYIGPFLFAVLRTLFSFVVLAAGLAVAGRLKWPRRNVWRLVLLGLLQTGGFTGFTYLALVAGGSGRTALLAFTNPLWATLGAWYVLSERPRPEQIIAVALALVGIVVVVQPWALHGSLISSLYALLAGLSLGLASIVVQRLCDDADADLVHITTWQLLFGLGPLLALAMAVPETPVQINATMLFGLAYNVVATAVCWPLWAYILQRLPAGVANVDTLVIPLIGIMSGWLILNEELSRLDLIGMACVSSSLMLLWLTKKKLQRRARYRAPEATRP
jgi:drug/metabolite transporter (DMT)-like permease